MNLCSWLRLIITHSSLKRSGQIKRITSGHWNSMDKTKKIVSSFIHWHLGDFSFSQCFLRRSNTCFRCLENTRISLIYTILSSLLSTTDTSSWKVPEVFARPNGMSELKLAHMASECCLLLIAFRQGDLPMPQSQI